MTKLKERIDREIKYDVEFELYAMVKLYECHRIVMMEAMFWFYRNGNEMPMIEFRFEHLN